MRIALVALGFPPYATAGLEVASEGLATALARSGHQVHVVTGLDRCRQREVLRDGFWIHSVPVMNRRLVGIPSFWLSTVACINHIRPDVVHVQSMQIGIGGLVSKIVAGTPFVVCCHGSDVYGKWPLKTIVTRIVLSNADAVVALTSHMRSAILAYSQRPVHIIPNGVFVDQFASKKTKWEARADSGLPTSRPVILYAGRLIAAKGVGVLLGAMSTIKSTIPDVLLLVAGTGSAMQELEMQSIRLGLTDCVRFLGMVPSTDIANLMASADALVLPSYSEGFPMVLLEGIAAGLPIVATDVTGIGEIVVDGVNGILVPAGDQCALGNAVIRLLSDSRLRLSIAQRNRVLSAQYDWSNIASRFAQLYRVVAGTNR